MSLWRDNLFNCQTHVWLQSWHLYYMYMWLFWCILIIFHVPLVLQLQLGTNWLNKELWYRTMQHWLELLKHQGPTVWFPWHDNCTLFNLPYIVPLTKAPMFAEVSFINEISSLYSHIPSAGKQMLSPKSHCLVGLTLSRKLIPWKLNTAAMINGHWPDWDVG